jgi:hypothetical protein
MKFIPRATLVSDENVEVKRAQTKRDWQKEKTCKRRRSASAFSVTTVLWIWIGKLRDPLTLMPERN